MKTILGLSLLAAVYSAGLYAQSVAGSGAVTGTVRDANGEGLPDATVILRNQSMGIRRTMISNDDGVFDAPALAPSKGYGIKVTRKGFADWESNEFDVSAGQTLNFDIEMQVEGTPAAEIDPGRALSPVDDTRVGVSTLVGRPQIDGLPTSDRRLDELALLAPAVSTDGSLGAMAFHGHAFANSFLTDGLSTTNNYYFFQRPGIANQLPQDAVEGVQVLLSDASTEFGRAMGGTVNAVTRSGANSFHGAGYGYLGKRSLSATDRFALGQNSFQKQNQAGGSLGGPILPGKVFFFLNGEDLESHFQDLNRITNPLIADSTGSSVLLSNCRATVVACTAAVQFLQPQMNVRTPLSERWATGLAKIDYRRSDRHTFGLEANAMNSRLPDGAATQNVAPNGGLLGIGNATENTRFGKLSWIASLSPSAVNEARFGVFQDSFSEPASQANLSTGGLGIFVAGATAGAARPDSTSLKEQRYQLVENLNIAFYRHSIKFGGDVSQTRDSINQLANANGTFYYPSLTAFAQDLVTINQRNYSMFTQTFGNPSRALRSREFNVYAQDTWKAWRKLTLSFGVRWEKTAPQHPTETNSTYYNTSTIPSRGLNFAPRFSAAYLWNYRTALRASYGWYYAPYAGDVVDALFLGNALYQTSIVVYPNQSGALLFPKVFSSASIPSGTTNVMYAVSKWRNPYAQQSSVALERRLSVDTTLTVNLIHNRGLKLWTARDANLVAPTKTQTYTIYNTSGQYVSTFTTSVWTSKNDGTSAHVYEVGNGGSSWYDAVAVQLRKQMARALSVQLSYTWSHALDDVSGTPVVPGIPLNTSAADYSGDKGNSAADQRHRGVLNWVWQPTVIKSDSPFARFLVNGWELSGIATVASPQHMTPEVIAGAQQFSGITMLYTNSLNGSGGWDRVPFQKVNSLDTQFQYNLNARVTRTLPFTERVKGMLMFEAFNVLNNQYATAVNTVAYTSTLGVVKAVTGAGTGNASSGFPYGSTARRCQVAFRLVF
ncbi:MAG: carboxypeptidase regulatory-like domain-containing protein [Bryobacteraceae bacterium]|jgi:hypothetical protein